MVDSDGQSAPFLRRWRSRRVVVEDRSMTPTLAPGDRLLVDPQTLRRRAPRRGELVVVRDPVAPERWLVKRVAAVGPALVHVVRTGVVVSAAGGPSRMPADAIESTPVPAQAVYVVSDGPTGSRDSRTFGPVPPSALVGVAWYRYAPAPRAGPLPPVRS